MTNNIIFNEFIHFIYDCFIINAWIVPLITIILINLIKKYCLFKSIFSLKFIIPFICIVISFIFTVAIPDLNQPRENILAVISDTLSNGLVSIGIYEFYKSVRKYMTYSKMTCDRLIAQ
jgi:hypothetical protein